MWIYKISKNVKMWILTKRAWFSGVTLSRNTLLCNLCCSTWGFLDKTLRMSATIFCTKIRAINTLSVNAITSLFWKPQHPLNHKRRRPKFSDWSHSLHLSYGHPNGWWQGEFWYANEFFDWDFSQHSLWTGGLECELLHDLHLL